ncbi:restriction endonuclease subunit S [Gymnodinialimonas sp. 57CJ19]|uniref:restriction endonuclease subunit S n=1 Tax=Gymnodinialimonas sp. 57CJ19 TaxID=3138498 RepID=UPI003134543B
MTQFSQDWREVPLGDLVTFQRGYDITKAQQREGPYPVISSSGIKSYHAEYMFDGPGVIIGRKGSLGTVFYSASQYWPHDTTLWVKNFHGNDPRFCYFFLQGMGFQQYDVGAANPTLNRNHIHSLPVAIPPLPTQQRIAAILSAYDDLIENNTRRIAILEEMARRLYEEWFVHFRFPGHEAVEFVAEGDDRHPVGWVLGLLSDYIELKYGKALKASERVEGPFPVFGSSGVVGTHNRSLVDGPGIIVGRKGNVGSVFWSEDPFHPIDTVYFVHTALPLEYVYFNLERQNFLNNDAAVPGLNRQQAYSLPFLCPPNELLLRFVDVCKPLFAAHRLLNLKNANLRAQRDLLLPKLVSGEIDVSEAEAELEAAE